MKAIKKPIPVEVWGIEKLTIYTVVPIWVSDLLFGKGPTYIYEDNETHEDMLHTLEGNMTMNVGDYLLKGNHDYAWVVRKDIFEETYEVVE